MGYKTHPCAHRNHRAKRIVILFTCITWVTARLKLPDDKISLANSKSKLRKYLASNVALKPYYKDFERRKEVLEAHDLPEKSRIRSVFTNFKPRD